MTYCKVFTANGHADDVAKRIEIMVNSWLSQREIELVDVKSQFVSMSGPQVVMTITIFYKGSAAKAVKTASQNP
jgi:hypothetical protein